MTSHVIAVARQEFRIAARNRWVLLAALILLVFALVLGLLGSAPSGSLGVGRLAITVASLATLSVYLVPLLALLLGFDAIAGEVERGTLPLVLSTPVARGSVILGKFLGHLAVIALAIVIGFGIAGAAVMVLSGEGASGLIPLARLIASSIALGAVFLAVSYVVSASTTQVGTSAAVAVAVWLALVVLYDLGLLGALVLDPGGGFAQGAFPWMLLASPADAFRLFNLAALDIGNTATGLAGATEELPFSPALCLASLALWLALAFLAALRAFYRLEP
ncbi:MAG: ABC transporter permease subunit [Bauldia sp.]|nr:ABC transporter permease subunit [Bauldia sp.]